MKSKTLWESDLRRDVQWGSQPNWYRGAEGSCLPGIALEEVDSPGGPGSLDSAALTQCFVLRTTPTIGEIKAKPTQGLFVLVS